MSQRELLVLLGISLGTLRELLPRLEGEDLIQVMPQRGIQITTIDLRMIRNAYELRMAYECEAVLAAVERLDPVALEAQRARHLDVLARAAKGADAALLDEAQSVDAGLHACLVEATGNALLIRAYGVNSIRVRLINLERMRMTPAILPQALGDHMQILDALVVRDPQRAVAAMRRHIENARARAVAF